jgi:hypothetical protein
MLLAALSRWTHRDACHPPRGFELARNVIDPDRKSVVRVTATRSRQPSRPAGPSQANFGPPSTRPPNERKMQCRKCDKSLQHRHFSTLSFPTFFWIGYAAGCFSGV